MKNIFLFVLLNCLALFSNGQSTDTIIGNDNIIGVKTGIIYNRGFSYYINPYYLRRFKSINVKSGLFYGSDIFKNDDIYHAGLNAGCQILFFRKSKLVRPYSELMLLFIGTNYSLSENRSWKWGGGVFLGSGIEFKIKRLAVGGGVDFGIVDYYPTQDQVEKSLVLWLTPTIHFSYSFK